MKKLAIPVLFILMGCSVLQDDKKEATEFAKKMVKTYFDLDCKGNLQLYADSVRMFVHDLDTLISFKDLIDNDEKEYCKTFRSNNQHDTRYTFQDYLNHYEIRIYSKKEFADNDLMEKHEEDQTLAESLYLLRNKFTDSDYLFVGDHLKKDIKESELKIQRWRSFVKIISKTKNGWKITGTLP